MTQHPQPDGMIEPPEDGRVPTGQTLVNDAPAGHRPSGFDPSRGQGKNELSILDKPHPALPILAEAIGCDLEDALLGLRALVNAGYVIAPLEPTNAMLVAYLQTYCEPTHAASVLRGAAKARRRWKAMASAGLAMAMSRRFITDISWLNASKIVAETVRDSDASLAEDAKRLSPEGVAARAEGIAKDQPA